MDTNTSDNQDLTLLDDQGKKGLWNQILTQIKIIHPVKIYPYIKEGQFISADNEEIVIGFPKIYNFHRSRLEDVVIKEEVERVVEKVSGLKISVALVTIGGNGVDGEIIREQQVQITPASLNPAVEKTVMPQADPAKGGTAPPNSIKSSNGLVGSNTILPFPSRISGAGDDERRLREKVLQDERLRKILEVFEGKLVRVKKSQ